MEKKIHTQRSPKILSFALTDVFVAWALDPSPKTVIVVVADVVVVD